MTAPAGSGLARPAAARAICFAALWLALAGAKLSGLPFALAAVAAATAASLRLLPPDGRTLSPRGVARLVWRFPRQSVLAGVDVARRAFDPRMPLRPGLVAVPSHLRPGVSCDAFCMLTSLLPGALPLGADEAGALVFHCLDTGQPMAANLAVEETLFLDAIGGAPA